MAFKANTDTRDTMLAAINTAFTGALSSTLKIYTGTQPATAGGAHADTELASFDMQAGTGFNSPSGGSMAWNFTIAMSTTAGASGTAGWFRWTLHGNETMDGDVTATGGGGVCEITTTSITNGDTVNLTTFTLSIPES